MYILTTYHIGDGLSVQRIEDKDAAIAGIWSTIQRYSDGAITHKSKLYAWLSDTKERINQMGFCDDSCGLTKDRDLNAAENLAHYFYRE